MTTGWDGAVRSLIVILVAGSVRVAVGETPSAADIQARVNQLEQRVLSLERDIPTNSVLPPPDWLRGFEFHGYLRSGNGINSEGGHMQVFHAPGADAKYRLGNENDTYGELALAQNFARGTTDPFFRVQTRLAYSTKQYQSYDADNDQFTVREAFIQAGRFEPIPDVTFWAGERFYRREDIHINDFYILDTSGYGGGFEDVPLGPLKAAVAYIGGSNDKYEFNRVGQVDKNSLDLRLYDLALLKGKVTLWIAPSALRGGQYNDAGGTNHPYDSSRGFAAGLLHLADLPRGGYNKFSIQYGRGTGSDFSPNVQDPSDTLDEAWQFRVTDSTVIQPCDSFAVMTALIAQRKNSGADKDSNLTWLSGGLRPIVNLTRHFGVAFEGGVDWVDRESDGIRGALYKFTVAPELRFDSTFFGRPELRLFATYATWDEDLKGQVGGQAFGDQTDGLNVGIQAEAWW